MTDLRKTDSGRPSRRGLLKGLGLAAASGAFSVILGDRTAMANEPNSSSPAQPALASGDRHTLGGIDPKNVVDEYQRRDLDALSDSNLWPQASAIISAPPTKLGDSFSLHAPLEVMARFGLLPLVDPQQRRLARLQLVASSARFAAETTGRPLPKAIAPFPHAAAAKEEFTRTFQHADADGLEAIVLQFAAQFGTPSLVHLLTPLALPTLTGASHSHIGLWLLLRHARGSDTADAALLRAAARALATDPKLQLKSFAGMSIAGDQRLKQTPAEVEQEIVEKFADPPKGKPGGGGMRGLFDAGEATGTADNLFADFIRHDLSDEQIDAAFRATLRVCAHNMLQHGPQQAKFGWSHCLTLPQAAFGLSNAVIDRKLALAATLVWTTAYRCILSDRALDMRWTPAKLAGSASVVEALQTAPTAAAARVWHADPSELPEIKQTLATQASIRSDQHLIKYTRACFDMMVFDPQFERLYLAAAAHLCGVWVKERPESQILNSLSAGNKGS